MLPDFCRAPSVFIKPDVARFVHRLYTRYAVIAVQHITGRISSALIIFRIEIDEHVRIQKGFIAHWLAPGQISTRLYSLSERAANRSYAGSLPLCGSLRIFLPIK